MKKKKKISQTIKRAGVVMVVDPATLPPTVISFLLLHVGLAMGM